MRIVDFVRLLNVDLVPVRVTSFVPTKNQIGGTTRVKGKQNPIRFALMLDSQFLHVCITESRTVSTCGRPRDGPSSSSRSTEKLTLSCSSSVSSPYHWANSSLTSTVHATFRLYRVWYMLSRVYCVG